jgi:hypothetical protein
VSELFKYIFGRPAEPRDSKTCRKMHEIMEYYASKRTATSTWKGKRIPAGTYKMKTFAGLRVPYSIRLRLELNEDNRQYTTSLREREMWKPGPKKIYGSVKSHYKCPKEDRKRGYGKRKKDWEESCYIRDNGGEGDAGPLDREGPSDDNDR